MKSDISVTADPGDRVFIYVGESQTPPTISFMISEPGGVSTKAAVRMTRAQFEKSAAEAAEILASLDRVAAARRGEAVPAVVVSDGEAATKLLRSLVESRVPLVGGADFPDTTYHLKYLRALAAAAAFLGIGL